MRVLAVDTSSERGSVCVVDQGEIIGEVRLASSIQHSERLFRSIEFLFQYLPFPLADIELFAAAQGPGSFTGLRVGLAAMQGFCSAYGKRSAGVPTLQALAWKAGIQNRPLVPMIDARRGEVYGAVYRRAGEILVEQTPPVVLKPAEWLNSLGRQRLIFCGDGAVRYRAMIQGEENWTIHPMDFYLAGAVAERAAKPGCGPLEPVYVRKPEAEIAREGVASPNP